MTTQSCSIYKDCTPQDFDHYFKSTCMAWNLSPHKKRLFVVEGVTDSNKFVHGQFLTRDREWKEKKIPWAEWWDVLTAILPHPVMFNLKDGCATWSPQLASNRKKSFPFVTSSVRFFGKVNPEEQTEQNVVGAAFEDLYSHVILPNGLEALRSHRSATVSNCGLLFDKTAGTLYYKRVLIGKLTINDRIELLKPFFMDLLVTDGGINPDRIILVAPAETKKEEPKKKKLSTTNAALVGFAPQAGAMPAPGAALGNVWFYGGGNNPLQHQQAQPAPHFHHLRPPTNFHPGWALNIYDQGQVPMGQWVKPQWGRGYAVADGLGRITTFQGPGPVAVGGAAAGGGGLVFSVWNLPE